MPEVRLIRYDELDELLALYAQLHAEDPIIERGEQLKQAWDEIYDDPGMLCLVLEEDGKIVSSCTLAIVKNLTRGLRPYGIIENVVTHSDHRKRGYGTQVLRKAVEMAKDKDCYKVMLMTSHKDEETLRFYENAGFVRGIKTGFIAYP
jgi:GNAT superfamily N-acetyltransferase